MELSSPLDVSSVSELSLYSESVSGGMPDSVTMCAVPSLDFWSCFVSGTVFFGFLLSDPSLLMSSFSSDSFSEVVSSSLPRDSSSESDFESDSSLPK